MPLLTRLLMEPAPKPRVWGARLTQIPAGRSAESKGQRKFLSHVQVAWGLLRDAHSPRLGASMGKARLCQVLMCTATIPSERMSLYKARNPPTLQGIS